MEKGLLRVHQGTLHGMSVIATCTVAADPAAKKEGQVEPSHVKLLDDLNPSGDVDVVSTQSRKTYAHPPFTPRNVFGGSFHQLGRLSKNISDSGSEQ
eukprot:6367740-Amphidinium_carterae.1